MKNIKNIMLALVVAAFAVSACADQKSQSEDSLSNGIALLTFLSFSPDVSEIVDTPPAGEGAPEGPPSTGFITLKYEAGDGTAYPVGTAIQVNNPIISGSANPSVFTVNPALPAGLSLDPATGIISGTPAAVTGFGVYTVTVSTDTGATDTHAMLLSVVANAADVTCNTSGIAPGCSASFPRACPFSTLCFNTLNGCRESFECNYYL